MRVVPSDLPIHRESHQFVGPCCLCPLFLPNSEGLYVEASMCFETLGVFSGHFVAKCARSECGYYGRLPFSLSKLLDSEET